MTVKPPPSSVLLLLAMGAGLSAANLYYNQPMLGLITQAFETTEGRVGLVPMATQAGYAVGILGFAAILAFVGHIDAIFEKRQDPA